MNIPFKEKLQALKSALGVRLDRAHDMADSTYERGRLDVPDTVPAEIKAKYLQDEQMKTPMQIAQDKKMFTPMYAQVIARMLRSFDNPQTTYKDHK